MFVGPREHVLIAEELDLGIGPSGMDDQPVAGQVAAAARGGALTGGLIRQRRRDEIIVGMIELKIRSGHGR